ncbi:hypothetical protein D3C87_1682080 [compost metagenome]
MLESCREVVQFIDAQSNLPPKSDLSPVRHGCVDLGQDSDGLFLVQCEVRRVRQQHMHVGDRSVFLGQPGLGFPFLVRKRVDVECGRKAPKSVLHVQETMVLQVIIHIGNQ